jgi:hypothetical protein
LQNARWVVLCGCYGSCIVFLVVKIALLVFIIYLLGVDYR